MIRDIFSRQITIKVGGLFGFIIGLLMLAVGEIEILNYFDPNKLHHLTGPITVAIIGVILIFISIKKGVKDNGRKDTG